MLFKKLKKGFTLIELVVVIAVIAILSAVAIVSYLSITNKAKESNDHMVIDQVNTLVQSSTYMSRKATVHELVESLDKEDGYDIRKIAPELKGTKFVYCYEENMFGYWKNNSVVYPKALEGKGAGDGNNIWFFEDVAASSYADGYSHYLKSSSITAVSVDGGVDLGDCSSITSVSFARSTKAAKNVVIRTNSASVSLTVNAPKDVIYHYDALGALNIVESATASYHENGKVAYAEISKGRIVLEKGSDVEEIHVNKKNDSSFDTVIIANNGGSEELPERITRDTVTVSEETLVVKVESKGSSENVYVYANGSVGTTEKTSTQNTSVESALGQLVLDNGSNPGEKAQTVEEKEAAKQEAVQEAIVEEIEESDKYVARIGTTPFESLKDAIAGAAVNDVIEMTANDPSAENLTVNKVVTIRMNGKTYGGKIVVATTGANAVTVVGEANVDAITKFGDRYFNNLVFANNGTVTLLKDISTSQIYRTAYSNTASNWCLDLNGHTLTVTYDDSEGGIYVGSYYGTNHTLTINNGNLNFTGTSSSSVAMHAYGNLVLNNVNVTSSCGTAIKAEAGYWDGPGNVTLNNVVINSQGKGIDIGAYKSGNTVKQSVGTFSNVTINSSNIGVYINGASCTMENCTINSGSYAVQTVLSSGALPNVVISGTGSITSQGYNTIDCKGGTMQISGNIEVSGGTSRTVYVQSSSLTIAGGTYLGNFGLGASGQLTIAGGTYNGNLIDVTQAGRLLVIGETQFEELVTYSITGSNGSYDVQVAA